MKSTRPYSIKSRYSAFVQRGGRIALPPDTPDLHLGQRIYFFAQDGQIGFMTRPKGRVHGRLLSARVRRSVRSLAIYGPRTRVPIRRSIRR
jgi:hypothetical protein